MIVLYHYGMRIILLIAAIIGGFWWIDGRYYGSRFSNYALREIDYRGELFRYEVASWLTWLDRAR